MSDTVCACGHAPHPGRRCMESERLPNGVYTWCACPIRTSPAVDRLEHVYVSTACQHRNHSHCRLSCKWCLTQCRCRCHAPVVDPPDVQRPASGKLRDRLFSVVFKYREGQASAADVFEAIDETIAEVKGERP